MRERPPNPARNWRATRARPAEASGRVERDAVGIFWEVFGTGEPAILMLPTWSVLHAAHGRFQIADLARHYRVIAFDGRGNGRSDRPAGAAAYDDREFVADAVAVLDATGTESAVVVACSQATHWLLRLAAEHPRRVLAAVLSGTNLPLAPGYSRPAERPFHEPYASTEGWARWNAAYWRDHYEDFLRFFFSQVWTEPHSDSVIEDCVAWGLETTPDTLVYTADAPGFEDPGEALEMAARVECPTLVIHGGNDAVTPVERSVRVAQATDARLVILDGAGHCSGNRDPVKFNLLIREFVESVVKPPTTTRWTRAMARPRRVLFVPDGGRSDAVVRDVAIADALRSLEPDIAIQWLAPQPVAALLEDHGKTAHPASDGLLSEVRPAEPSGDDEHDFVAHRRIDEVLFVNFMVFADLVRDEAFDLVVADGAWQIDHYLHQNPELKVFSYAWLTDRVGWAPTAGETEREAALRTAANAEMVEQVERYRRLRDIAVYVGDSATLPDGTFGPGLPSVRDWTRRHFTAADGSRTQSGMAKRIAWQLRRLI